MIRPWVPPAIDPDGVQAQGCERAREAWTTFMDEAGRRFILMGRNGRLSLPDAALAEVIGQREDRCFDPRCGRCWGGTGSAVRQ